MNKNYFTLNEDFEGIIESSLKNKDILNINFISTGWTNIVYEVETNDGNYFFRFPRDDFWTRTIEKDCEFSEFINGKTYFNTVNLKLNRNENRPFSIHKKIKGTVLADKMNDMTDEEIEAVSKEISEFMYELHTTEFDRDEIFNTDRIGLNLVDFLDELINMHLSEESKKFWKYKEFKQKDNTCLVHGDLNSSNILLDDNNHIAGIIDFGFAGFGNKYFDIARIIGRCPAKFKNAIIKSYEEISKEKLDYDVLDEEIKIWSDIDNGYINYMRKIGIYEA